MKVPLLPAEQVTSKTVAHSVIVDLRKSSRFLFLFQVFNVNFTENKVYIVIIM